jgi:protein-S-isoprenylcysteine O-methyltransferase Ste14
MFAMAVLWSNAWQLLLWDQAGQTYLWVHATSWALWFLWQGWVFPRARERYLCETDRRAYAVAFYRQIWPGVSLGVSHMTLPVTSSLRHASTDTLAFVALGLAVAAAGAAMMWAGFRTIGIAQAGFVGEYRPVQPSMCRRSIYAVMRHPLFVGGALVSFGGVLLLGGDPADLRLAMLNLLILPLYQMIEDRRLTRVFGLEYALYSRRVGGVVPGRVHVAEAFSWIAGLGRVARQP